MMYHTCLKVTCGPEFAELLMAEIGEAGFDTFLENDNGFEAYTEMDQFDAKLVQSLLEKYSAQTAVTFTFDKVEKKNWNEAWEKSYQPVVVDDRCLIRADFHKVDKRYPYELIITPKMSFGTGHHQTTCLMIKSQMDIDHRGKRVMDAGCGTAILSIMASKLGASQVEAFDIDEWSVSNGKENIEVNQCPNIHHQQGKLSELSFQVSFDIILANINKNVLLDEISLYSKYLIPAGLLLLSGFYQEDITDLVEASKSYGLQELKRDKMDDWAALILVKV
jgi:ribosomal protein L11 methyltransferase